LRHAWDTKPSHNHHTVRQRSSPKELFWQCPLPNVDYLWTTGSCECVHHQLHTLVRFPWLAVLDRWHSMLSQLLGKVKSNLTSSQNNRLKRYSSAAKPRKCKSLHVHLAPHIAENFSSRLDYSRSLAARCQASVANPSHTKISQSLADCVDDSDALPIVILASWTTECIRVDPLVLQEGMLKKQLSAGALKKHEQILQTGSCCEHAPQELGK
jgi:hypothetical protein